MCCLSSVDNEYERNLICQYCYLLPPSIIPQPTDTFLNTKSVQAPIFSKLEKPTSKLVIFKLSFAENTPWGLIKPSKLIREILLKALLASYSYIITLTATYVRLSLKWLQDLIVHKDLTFKDARLESFKCNLHQWPST